MAAGEGAVPTGAAGCGIAVHQFALQFALTCRPGQRGHQHGEEVHEHKPQRPWMAIQTKPTHDESDGATATKGAVLVQRGQGQPGRPLQEERARSMARATQNHRCSQRPPTPTASSTVCTKSSLAWGACSSNAWPIKAGLKLGKLPAVHLKATTNTCQSTDPQPGTDQRSAVLPPGHAGQVHTRHHGSTTSAPNASIIRNHRPSGGDCPCDAGCSNSVSASSITTRLQGQSVSPRDGASFTALAGSARPTAPPAPRCC